MSVTINSDIIKENGLTLNQFIFLLSINNRPSAEEITALHKDMELLNRSLDGSKIKISKKGADLIDKIIIESIQNDPKKKATVTANKNRILALAREMQELYPKGRKPGTNNYWRGNISEITDRLTVFFKKFGDYTDEQIINATKKYIDSFNGDYQLMKTLKYFISKKNPDSSFQYDLLTFIENYDSKDTGGDLKTSRLV